MSRTPEGIEKDKVKRYLNKIGAYHYWPVPGGYGKQGVDCYACIPRGEEFPGLGMFCAIEVKAEGGQVTKRQFQTLEEVRKCGGLAFVGTGDEIINLLSRHAI